MANIVPRLISKTISKDSRPKYEKRGLVSALTPEMASFITLGYVNKITQWGGWASGNKLAATSALGSQTRSATLIASRSGFISGNTNNYIFFNTDRATLVPIGVTTKVPQENVFMNCVFRHDTSNITGRNEILQGAIISIWPPLSISSSISQRMPAPIPTAASGIELSQNSSKAKTFWTKRTMTNIFAGDQSNSFGRPNTPLIYASGGGGIVSSGISGTVFATEIEKRSYRIFIRNRVKIDGFLAYSGVNWGRDFQATNYLVKTALTKNAVVQQPV